MSWRVTFRNDEGLQQSPSLRTRAEAMIFACDIDRADAFVKAEHSSGQTLSKTELEAWRRKSESMLKGRVSPRRLVTETDAVEGRFKR